MEIQVLEARSSKGYRKKVCAYCRVSTDALEQENSLENQIAYYENLIQSNPEYEYAGVYYDFAISGYKEKRSIRISSSSVKSDSRSKVIFWLVRLNF